MLGLLYRDLINLKPSIKTTVISIVLLTVVFVIMEFGMAVAILLPMELAFISIGTFQWDAALSWRKAAGILPVRKEDIVLTKYIVFTIMMIAGMLLGLVFGYVYMTLTDFALSNQHFTLLKAAALGVTLPLSFATLFFPCAFYFKGEKLDMAMISCVTIMFVIIAAGALLIKYTTIDFQYSDLTGFIYASTVVSIVLFLASYFVSVWIFKKKEVE